MNITTKAQAKTVVSALRREVKTLGKLPSEMSHNDCLTLMAKALGFASWNAWEATLVEASVAVQPEVSRTGPRYPLVNTGDFDFVEAGEDGKPFSGRLVEITGTSDTVRVTGGVSTACRPKEGGIAVFQGSGSSDVDWDSQKTLTDTLGDDILFDDSAEEYSSAQVVLAPDECYDPYEDEDLPVRAKLIQAFCDYIAEKKIDIAALDGDFSAIEGTIGFGLTSKEEEALASRLASLNAGV